MLSKVRLLGEMEPALFSAANLFDAHSSGTFFSLLPSFLPSLSLIHSCHDVWCLPLPCIVSLFLCFLQHSVSLIKKASRASEMIVIHRHLLLLLLLMATTVLSFFEMQNDVRWEGWGELYPPGGCLCVHR